MTNNKNLQGSRDEVQAATLLVAITTIVYVTVESRDLEKHMQAFSDCL